jgi:hypothetical protein
MAAHAGTIFTRAVDTIRTGFLRNPIAWILMALLAAAEYGNYQRGRELDRVCELLGQHDLAVNPPRTAKEEIDNICISREPPDDDQQD